MAKVQVEFINTCPCCDEYGRIIQAAAAKHADEVDAAGGERRVDVGYLSGIHRNECRVRLLHGGSADADGNPDVDSAHDSSSTGGLRDRSAAFAR